MNIKEFDEFVEMWDEEGQTPDVDWLEYAQDFRNQTQQLEVENAALKRENERIRRGLHELAQYDYRLGIDSMRDYAYALLTAEEQE